MNGNINSVENIYFVNNFHGIQYFLTLFNHAESNLVIASDNKALTAFLNDIIPDCPKLIVPQLKVLPVPFRFLYVLLWRFYYCLKLRGVSPDSRCFFAHKGGCLHLLILINYLKRKGVKLNYIKMDPEFYEEEIGNIGFLRRIYLNVCGIFAGVKLTDYITRKYKYYGMKNIPEPQKIVQNDWKMISLKFNFPMRNTDKNAVLLIDAPIQTIDGVDIRGTQKKIVSYFTNLINNGKAVHLKPHYTTHCLHSFSGTPLESKLNVLPGYFPVEIIMEQYSEIYFFCSTASACHVTGKKYCLFNLLVFKSEVYREQNVLLNSDFLKNEDGFVEYVGENHAD